MVFIRRDLHFHLAEFRQLIRRKFDIRELLNLVFDKKAIYYFVKGEMTRLRQKN